MSDDLDDWRPMSEDFQSVSFNSYSSGQAGAYLPYHLLPSFNSQFGSQTSQQRSQRNVKLFINGFPSDLTETGLSCFLKRIGCKLLTVKIIESKTRLGQHFSFIDFESAKYAQKAIELIKSQSIYKLFVSFASTQTDREVRDLLIDRENEEFKRQLSQQNDMKQKIDLGNHLVINANTNLNSGSMSPIQSDSGSHESSILDVLSPLAKTDKLLKVLEKTDDDCSYCTEAQPVDHLHYILAEQLVLDPTAMPALLDITCQTCGQKAVEMKLCSNCKSANYCGLVCQKTDWRRHRADCKADEVSLQQLNSTSIANKSSNSFRENHSQSKRRVAEDSVKTTPNSAQNIVKEPKSIATSSPTPNQSNIQTSADVNTIRQIDSSLTNGSNLIEEEREEQELVIPKAPEPVPKQVTTSPEKVNRSSRASEALKVKPIDRTVETEELIDGEDNLTLCFGRNPFDFYLQKASSYEKMNIFADQLDKRKDDFPDLADKDLREGVLCGGIYSADGNCYRARIMSRVDEDTFALYFIDYGNTEAVPIKDIKILPNIFFDCKAQAIHCSLHQIQPSSGNWDKEAVRVFGQIGESNEYTKVKIFEKTSDGLHKIDLINKNGHSIRKALVNKKLASIPVSFELNASPVAEKAVVTPISSPTRPSNELSDSPVIVEAQASPKVVFNKSSVNEIGRTFKQRIFSSDESSDAELKSCLEALEPNSKFECIITEPFNVEEIQYFGTNFDTTIEKMISELAADYPLKSGPIMPKVDDIVVAKGSDEDFYRSYVLSTNGSTAKVFMIDGGFVEDVCTQDIYKMTPKFNKYPSYVVLLVPETRSAAVFLELTATKEVALLSGTFVRRDGKSFVVLDKNSIEVMGFKSAVNFMKSSYNRVIDSIDSTDDQMTSYFDRLPLREIPLNKPHEALVLYQDKTDSDVFFIAGDSSSFKKVMDKCAEHCLKFNDGIKVNPLVGDVYLVQSTEDKEWYRAVINSVSDDKCDVIYIDFGNGEQIDNKYVMELPADLQVKNLMPIAVKCKVESTHLSAEDLQKKIENASFGTYLLKLEPTKRADGFHLVKVL